MGCITGLIAKIFLMAFNVAVVIVGVAVLSLASVTAVYLTGYGDLVPPEPFQVLIGLQTTSSLVMCLGVFGVVVACCCTNKLFLYTHFIVGAVLVVAVLTFAGLGTTNLDKGNYEDDIKALMESDMAKFNINMQKTGEYEKKMNEIYHTNECCGIKTYSDWGKKQQTNKLPLGCCKAYDPEKPSGPCTSDNQQEIFMTGCLTKMEDDIGDVASTCFKLAIFFGVLLFALLTSTCLCVKCTNAMPI